MALRPTGSTGDHYDLPTRVMAICPKAADRMEFLQHLVESPRDYDPARRTSRVHGSLIAKVEAPPGTKIAWISAGGSFTANVGAAQQTRNGIAYAVTEAGPFHDLYRAEVPSDQSHWHYNVDREVRLEEPVRKVFVQYTGDPAVNNVRLFAHCVEDLPRARAPLVLTHVWTESGVRKSKQAKLDGPGDYEIEVNAEPVDESIELAIPSVARTAKSPAPGGGEGIRRTDARDPRVVQPPTQSWFPQGPPLPAPQDEEAGSSRCAMGGPTGSPHERLDAPLRRCRHGHRHRGRRGPFLRILVFISRPPNWGKPSLC